MRYVRPDTIGPTKDTDYTYKKNKYYDVFRYPAFSEAQLLEEARELKILREVVQ